MIIPEGVRSLYSDKPNNTGSQISKSTEHSHEENDDQKDFSKVIGLSLVLGFVFMMLVDQISSRRSVDSENKRNPTATIGLGNYSTKTF